MKSRFTITVACFDNGMLSPPIVAALMTPENLKFVPDHIRTSHFLKSGGAFLPQYHISMTAESTHLSSLALEVRSEGHMGNTFDFRSLPVEGLQTITWRLQHDLGSPDAGLSNLLSTPGFNAAYSVDSEDHRWQSAESLNHYEVFDRSFDGLPLIPDESMGGLKIDISRNPGRRHLLPHIWLQSCWRMWFGGKAFTYMPKERLLSFPEARRVEELPSGVVFIELYEDPFAADDPENRRIQQAFRDWVDMDRIQATAHQLFPHAADPTYSMERGEFDHGGVCLLIRWVDKKGKPVPRSQAVKKQMQELDEDGQLVWSGSEPVIAPS